MKAKQVLILEDNLETLSIIFRVLSNLKIDISPIVLSEYVQVEEMINNTNREFDLILLDRDCNMGGSFHVLDIEKFGADKIISISSVPQYNDDAVARGVSKVVYKELNNLDYFSEALANQIKKMLI